MRFIIPLVAPEIYIMIQWCWSNGFTEWLCLCTLNVLRLHLLCCVCQQCAIILLRNIREIWVLRYLHMPLNIIRQLYATITNPAILVCHFPVMVVQEHIIFHPGVDHWWIKISFLLSAVITTVRFKKACPLIRHIATWAVFYREKDIFAAPPTPGTVCSLKHESSMPLSYMSLHKWIQHCLCINQHRIIQALQTNNFWKKNVANQDGLSYPELISWRSCQKPPIIITEMAEDPSWLGGEQKLCSCTCSISKPCID